MLRTLSAGLVLCALPSAFGAAQDLPRHSVISIYQASRQTAPYHKPDYGPIRFQGSRGPLLKGTVRVNTLKAPPKARKAFEAAQSELLKRKPNRVRASRKLDKALKVYPEFSAAWNLRGILYLEGGEEGKARLAFARAIEHDPEALDGHLSLALLEMRKSNWRRAALHTTRLLELEPKDPSVRYFHGLTCYYRGYFEAAEVHLEPVAERPGNHDEFPLAQFFLANTQAELGRFQEAASLFRSFLKNGAERFPQDLGRRIRKKMSDWEEEGLLAGQP